MKSPNRRAGLRRMLLHSPREFRKAMCLEFTRALVLEQYRETKILASERDAERYAVWYLIDPLGLGSRKKVEIPFYAPEEFLPPFCPPRPRGIRLLIAHSHSSEPLVPSPDDLLLFDRLDLERGACIHCIADGFRIVRIR